MAGRYSCAFVMLSVAFVWGIGGCSARSSTTFLTELERLAKPLDTILNYFARINKKLILDSLYGLRIAQGHMVALKKGLRDVDARRNMKIIRYVEQLSAKVDRVITVGVAALRRNMAEKAYFDGLGSVITSRSTAVRLSRAPSMKASTPVSERIAASFNESSSDACMKDISGTGPSHKNCTLTPVCVQLMMKPLGARSRGYELTHQLLFSQLAVRSGCKDVYEAALRELQRSNPSDDKQPGTLRGLLDVGCANIYLEMQNEYQLMDTGDMNRDVFMEQGSLCSLYGYPMVLTKEWVDTVAQWMAPIGCFDDGRGLAYHPNRTVAPPSRRGRSTGDEESNANPWAANKEATSRKLLYDPEMADGCSQHATGLMACFLATRIRYEIELYFGIHDFDLSKMNSLSSRALNALHAAQTKTFWQRQSAHIRSTVAYLREKLGVLWNTLQGS